MVENKCSFFVDETTMSPEDRIVEITRRLKEEQMTRRVRSQLERRLRNIRNKFNPPPEEDPKVEEPKLARRLEEEQMSQKMRQRLQKRLRMLRNKLKKAEEEEKQEEGKPVVVIDPKEEEEEDEEEKIVRRLKEEQLTRPKRRGLERRLMSIRNNFKKINPAEVVPKDEENGKFVVAGNDVKSDKGSAASTTMQEDNNDTICKKKKNKHAFPELTARLAADIGGKLKMEDIVVVNPNVEGILPQEKEMKKIQDRQGVNKLKQRLANIEAKIKNLELRKAEVEHQLAEREEELLVQVDDDKQHHQQQPEKEQQQLQQQHQDEEEMTTVFHDFSIIMDQLDTALQGLADMDVVDDPLVGEDQMKKSEKDTLIDNHHMDEEVETEERDAKQDEIDDQKKEEAEVDDDDFEIIAEDKPQQQPKVSIPVLTKRLADIEEELQKEEDSGRRRELLKRWAVAENKLVEKKRNEAIKQSPFPGLSKDLLDVEKQLEEAEEGEDPAGYQELLQRKANVEAKLAEKLKMRAIQQGPFPIINMKLAKIDEQLKDVPEDDPQRGELEKTKAMLLVELAENREMMDACPGGNLSRQVERTQALLAEGDVTPERRYSLQKRLSHLQNRQEEASMSQLSIPSSISSYSAGGKKKEAPCCREKQKHLGIETRERLSSNEDPCREKEKNVLIALEKLARPKKKGGRRDLNKIALQQVYVGYYPESDNYVSLIENEVSIEQRAVLREEAIKLARSSPRVNWIAADMYERLPESWSLDDEINMFGNRRQKRQWQHQQQQKQQNNQQQQIPRNRNRRNDNNNNNNNKSNKTDENYKKETKDLPVLVNMETLDDSFNSVLPEYWHLDDSKAELLEDGFEKVILEANIARGGGFGGWTDI